MSFRRKRVIGVVETVSLPEWGLHGIVARIDTGALTSSIDVPYALLPAAGKNGRSLVRMTLGEGSEARSIILPVVSFHRVRNPSGAVTRRPMVKALVVLGRRRFRTPINLHRRPGMVYRLIIGRRALAGRFLVDVERSVQR
jgi:hypothetical protein